MALTQRTIRDVLERDGNACRICGRLGPPLHVSHVIPRPAGGDDSPDNLFTLCPSCDMSLARGPNESEFVAFLAALLHRHPDFRNIRQEVRLEREGRRAIADLMAEERVNGTWHQVLIECKSAPGFIAPRFNDLVSQLSLYKSPGVRVILAIPGRLPPSQVERVRALQVEVWDLDYMAARFDAHLAWGEFPALSSLLRVASRRRPTTTPEQRLLDELRACTPGPSDWVGYQRVIGRILGHLFCPPLQPPQPEVPDHSKVNRRDFVLANYCESGFWAFLRAQYRADFVVVDAKNYSKGVKKEQVLQIANYLKGHGPGMFAIIASRVGPSASAMHVAREQWIGYGKLILFLEDSDLEAMLLARGSGSEPEAIVRQKLQDFRLSL